MMNIKLTNMLRSAYRQPDVEAVNALCSPMQTPVMQSSFSGQVTSSDGGNGCNEGNVSACVVDVSPGEEVAMLWRMMAATAPPSSSASHAESGRVPQTRRIIRCKSNEAHGEFEAAMDDFLADEHQREAGMGLVVSFGKGVVVALHVHRQKDGQLSFSYYDPGAVDALRDRLRGRIEQRLARYGIVRERPFTGVRQGQDDNDIGTGGIYAVLAMREMLNGRFRLDIGPEKIRAWQARCKGKDDMPQVPAVEKDPFLQGIRSRSAQANQLARRIAERCPAMQYVFDCFSTREATRFQALNRRMYDEVMPRLLQQVSFKDYPSVRLVTLRNLVHKSLWVPELGSPIPQLTPELCGALLLSGAEFYLKMPPSALAEYLQPLLQSSSARFMGANAADGAFMKQLCRWLGDRLADHDRHGAEKLAHDHRLRKEADILAVKASVLPMSVTDMFMEQKGMSAALLDDISKKLDEAVSRRLIFSARKDWILRRLKGGAWSLLDGSVSIHLLSLPGKYRNEQYVRVMATRRDAASHALARTLWEYKDEVINASTQTRLSDKLKQDIVRHFTKLGLPERLGVMLGQTPPLPLPTHAHDASWDEELYRMAQTYAHFYALSEYPDFPTVKRELASLTAEVLSEELGAFFEKRVSEIHSHAFGLALRRIWWALQGQRRDVSFCCISAALMRGVNHVMSNPTVTPETLRRLHSLLCLCREYLALQDKVSLRLGNQEKAINKMIARLDTTIQKIAW